MTGPEWRTLLSWAGARQARHGWPALFLFTDARAGDPYAAISRLPRGRAGVVFRHDQLPRTKRAALLRRVRRLCAERRLTLSVGGRTHWRTTQPCRPALTAAVHDAPALHAARRAGARLAFISPVFQTRSHPDAAPLGVVRATRLAAAARRSGLLPFALGGMDARSARRLPPVWAGMGGIDMFVGR